MGTGLRAFGLVAALACASVRAQQPDPEAEAERLERLRSLPYAAWSRPAPVPDRRNGVTRYVAERASPGVNLYALPNRGEARLVGMDGSLVRRWASDVGQPGPGAKLQDFFYGWQHVALARNGDLLALVNRERLLRLDANSVLSWNRSLPLHHDLQVSADGSVYTIVDALRVVERAGRQRLVIDNEIVSFDAQGRWVRRFSLLDVLRSDPQSNSRFEGAVDRAYASFTSLAAFLGDQATGPNAGIVHDLLSHPRYPDLERAFAGKPPPGFDRELLSLLRLVPGEPADVLHANGLIVLDRPVPSLGGPGDVLVSVRELNLLAVVKSDTRQLGWTWGPGRVEGQHQPSVLANGHVLVFDNHPSWGHSRVVEVSPPTGTIVWSYAGTPDERFFSRAMGGCQALPNGNVLIVESEAGRAFEVTRAGEIVWEFLNPVRHQDARAVIYRMERLPLSSAAAIPSGGRAPSRPAPADPRASSP